VSDSLLFTFTVLNYEYELVENALLLEALEICVGQWDPIQGQIPRLYLYPRNRCISRPKTVYSISHNSEKMCVRE
jgi:hypothetical protein